MLKFIRIFIAFLSVSNRNDRMSTKNESETNFKKKKKNSIFLVSGSKAYYESKIYENNDLRELILQNMESPDDALIALSKAFLGNMENAIEQQNQFIEMFSIQPDPDEHNELKIGKTS